MRGSATPKRDRGRSAEVVDVGGDDRVVVAVVVAHDEGAVVGDAHRGADDVVAADVLDPHGTTDGGEALPVVDEQPVA